MKFSQFTFCNNSKSYLSPFCQFSKANGEPRANSLILGRNCLRYSNGNFLKELNLLLVLFQTVIGYPSEYTDKSKQTTFFNEFKKIILGKAKLSLKWSTYKPTKLLNMNNILAEILWRYKIECRTERAFQKTGT